MKFFLISLFLTYSFSSVAITTYTIKASGNDETFVINGEVFKAKTYCFNFDEGHKVIFLEGSASGACSSAKIYNKSNEKTCNVWCE